MFDEKASTAKSSDGGEGAATAEKKEMNPTAKAVKKIKDTQEKSTLGDIDALAALKVSLEANEKKDSEAENAE
jgi:small subunit ribosomal protein S1